MIHVHAWAHGACRRCPATRCTDTNRDAFRCTLAEQHTDAHRYTDGTTSTPATLEHQTT